MQEKEEVITPSPLSGVYISYLNINNNVKSHQDSSVRKMNTLQGLVTKLRPRKLRS